VKERFALETIIDCASDKVGNYRPEEPKFYADVEYRDITSEGLLRASSLKGLIKGTGRSSATAARLSRYKI
jgi:hypothetical protein